MTENKGNGEQVGNEELQEDQGEELQEIQEEDEVAKLTKELEDVNQRVLRISADFDNFRKRTRTEKEELAKYANTNLVNELLPVLDNFERALEVNDPSKEIANFLKGIDMIYKQLVQILNQSGLEPIKALGEPFDPMKHEAVMQVEDQEVADNTVIEELRKGYLFKERVLRPSMVKVVKNS